MRDRKVILIPASGTSGRGDRRGQIERPNRLGSAARPRRTGPTPRRPGLAVRAWGEVRAGPRWVGVAGSRSCCHSGFQAAQLGRRRSPREPGCARPRGRIPTSLRSRAPARERASVLRAPLLTLLPPPAPPSLLPLSSPLPFILTLLGRPMEVASWTVRAATLKSTEPVLGRASRPDPGQRPPKTCC